MLATPPPTSMNRERRQWTAQEDELLRIAVNREEPGNPAPSKWHAIAQHVPNRTNKDCRKRWYAKMSTDVVKGGWSPDEDQRLLSAIDTFGTRWSLVAAMVQTRNSDQCAKRWCDTLNPAIDRTAWSSEADDLLIQAVNEHGKVWTKIVQLYFPGRTGLAAKNRYNSITRAEGSSRGYSHRRHTPSSRSPSADPDPEPYYPGASAFSTQQPGHHRMSSQSGYPSQQNPPHLHQHSRATSIGSHHAGFSVPGRSHTASSSQFQSESPTSPHYAMPHPALSQPQAYYDASSARYSSPSQYHGPPPPLPGGNDSVFSDYSLFGQSQYPQQYPNPALNTAYGTSKYVGGGQNQASAGLARANVSDPRNWVRR